VLSNDCKDIWLAVNTGKTKYVEIERHRDMISNEHIRIGCRLSGDKSKFYLGGNKM
jgi:hypothetical protein